MKAIFRTLIAALALTAALAFASPQTDHLDMQGYRIERLGAGIASTDAATVGQINPTGSISMGFWSAAPSGWLLMQGGTIGDASSGGSARANADTENLFTYLWNNVANAQAPVSTGRGASAAADFAAHKTITIPDMRGRFPLGLAAAGTGSTIGGTGGAVDHTHSAPAHYHGMGTGADLNITSSGSGTSGTDSVDHSHFTAANGSGSNVAMSATASLSPGSNLGTDFSYTMAGSSLAATHGLTSGRSTTHTHSTPAHTHPSGNVAGRIGLVTGGVDGNAAMTSGTNNPPFLAVNFIIRL